jgi:tetratricopeptide (TPR) repeat protein
MSQSQNELLAEIQLHCDDNNLVDLEHTCRRYLATDPDNPQVLRIFSALLIDTGRPLEAESAIRHRLALMPGDAICHRDLGRALYDQKKFDESEDHFMAATTLDPTIPGSFLGIGNLYRDTNRLVAAQKAFGHELTRQPESPAAALALAATLASSGQEFLSGLVLKHFIVHKSDYAPSHIWHAKYLQGIGLLDQAMDAFRTAITLDVSLNADLHDDNINIDMRNDAYRDQTLYALYDLGISPLTFNIFHFLILSEIERKLLRLPLLHVIFVPGTKDGFGNRMENDSYLQSEGQHWRLHNLVMPATRLLPSCTGMTICASREEATWLQENVCKHTFPHDYRVNIPLTNWRATRNFSLRQVVQVYYQTGHTAFIRASRSASTYVSKWIAERAQGRPAVSLTLRRQDYLPGRNSDLNAWARFANWLTDQGFMPIIVRDTETLFQPMPEALKGLLEMPEAAINLDIRAALNEVNYVSIQSGGGPNALLYHSDRTRYAILRIIVESHESSSVPLFESTSGLRVGQQFPWAQPWQRMDYVDDSFDNLKTSFERIINSLETHSNQTAEVGHAS